MAAQVMKEAGRLASR